MMDLKFRNLRMEDSGWLTELANDSEAAKYSLSVYGSMFACDFLDGFPQLCRKSWLVGLPGLRRIMPKTALSSFATNYYRKHNNFHRRKRTTEEYYTHV